jgi:hypothetical protein
MNTLLFQLLTYLNLLVNPPLSQRTHAPTAQLDTPSSISPPHRMLNVPLPNFQARRSSIARSLFNLHVNLSQLARRVRAHTVEVKVLLEAKVVAVDHLDEDVAVDVDHVHPEVNVVPVL